MTQQMPTWMAMNEPAALAQVYRATCYCVVLPEGSTITLRIGEPAGALAAALKAVGARRWAIVAAVNPGSARLSPEENASRHRLLIDTVAASGRQFWPGVNLADAGDWPDEPTVCILDIGLPEALRLAATFDQNAIVAGDENASPELVWVSPTTT